MRWSRPSCDCAQELGAQLASAPVVCAPSCGSPRRNSGRTWPTSRKTADDVKAIVDERDIRFIRFWFTDILGQLKSFSINTAELDDAFEGGMGFDGSSITGFNAIEESDMIAMPDPSTFAVLPWRPEDKGVGADVLRRPHPRAASPTRATRATCCGARSSVPRRWASTPSTSAPSSSTSTSSARHRDGPARGARRGRLLRPHDARRRLRRAPRDRARARAARASTSSTPTTRSGPPSTRSTCATPTR